MRETTGRHRAVTAVVVTCAALALATAAQAGNSQGSGPSVPPYTPPHPDPPAHHPIFDHFTPNAVSFWNKKRGLIATGEEYRNRNRGGTIELTVNGGRSFHVVAKTKRGVAWVETAGKHSAWAAFQGDGHGKRLLHTRDGGKHWHWLPKAPAWSPSFSDARHGVTLASQRQSYGGSVLMRRGLTKTRDAGRSWHKVADPCDRYTEGQVISAGSNRTWWLACVGFQKVGTEEKLIYRSDDRGRSWDLVAASGSDHGELSFIGYIEELSFEPSGEGAILIDGGLWLSRQQGTEWRLARSGHAGINADFLFAQRRSADDIVAIRYGRKAKQLVRSTDGGLRWKLVHRWRLKIGST
jgi:photosystem II stability/assembly factor-like uncharacterized protein